MRIVIDMQGAQSTGSRSRGIGRYTLSLTQAIIRNRGVHDVYLALSGHFPDTIEPIRALFDGLLPQNNIRVWITPGPVYYLKEENHWRRRTAEMVREAFFASLDPDIVLISSLFEGLGDDAVTSIGRLGRNIPTAVVLYDLIPLIQRRPYLENPVVEAWYENKLDNLRRADLLLAISESSRQESIRYLGFADEACVNISTAADPHFYPQQIGPKNEHEVRRRYGLNSPFVMYTGGIDYRKNIEGLIRAYANLPKSLRSGHQLAIVCSIQPRSRAVLEKLAKEQGLKAEELILTGYVPEEDLVALYNLCTAFVFPSWHEGFGLPALEAMSCGKAVIGANTSSMPEVIGREDALFDPKNEKAITEKLAQVLTDESYRLQLEKNGLEQAKRFSWDISAARVIVAMEVWYSKQSRNVAIQATHLCRPKMAYISPLPPERSGISDYSAELLPELSRHYDIDVIVEQSVVSYPWVKANCPIRDITWFKNNAGRYDRVLYHFGNSQFHKHMFDLLKEMPGVVVLHDFFLSGIAAYVDARGERPGFFLKALYHSHGYAAVQRLKASARSEIMWRYPCNLEVLQDAYGIIVHSKNSRQLAVQWYGKGTADTWAAIPHLRASRDTIDRNEARRLLNLDQDQFVICSFGLLNSTKLNHILLKAWLSSALAADANCMLIFVGDNDKGKYGAELDALIRRSGIGNRIRITGWADTTTFRTYLAAADIGVQLRTRSRGETSGTVLDCMNYGLPTIVNAHGSMADLPDEGVWKLQDKFDEGELVEALETLWRDNSRRQNLGSRAKKIILDCHAPRACAEQYAQAIETMYQRALTGVPALTRALAKVEPSPTNAQAWIGLAEATALSIPPRLAQCQLLVDVSELVQRDEKTGIQLVVRSILQELLVQPPEGFRVEPVYATADQGYRYARQFTFQFLECVEPSLPDEPVEYRAGDIFLGLDWHPGMAAAQEAFYKQLRNRGVQVHFVIYDLLPIILPKAFPEGIKKSREAWLRVVAKGDGALCISRSVAAELADWLKTNGPTRQRPFKIGWFHLGAEISNPIPSKGMPEDAESVLRAVAARPSFLMVGTIEPQKGHAQTLAAFENLWAEGVETNLVIVGKQGWMVESLISRLCNHPESGKRLFWLKDISDEYLERIYASSTCLIAASEGEGFGLPLIEAAKHMLPIIARDIPVFREVAGEYAYFFSGKESIDLAGAAKNWLGLYESGQHPKSDDMPRLTWEGSARQIIDLITHKNHSQWLHNESLAQSSCHDDKAEMITTK